MQINLQLFRSSYYFLLLSLILSVSVSCTRKANQKSQITIQAPHFADLKKANSLISFMQWEGKKICYAVNVQGDGISQNGICGQNIGSFAGFVDQGQTISVTVARGSRRQFSLWASVVSSNANCPTVDDIQANKGLWADIYAAGSVGDITLDSEEKTIEIPVVMESNSLGAISGQSECGSQPGLLRAALLSSGKIVDENLNQFAIDSSMAIWESITFGLGLNGNSWTFLTSASLLASRTESDSEPTISSLSVAPYVHSITQKPGTREFFGLLEDGQIVAIDSSTGQVLTSQACGLDTCQVPVWVQSISVGNNQRVFALDHGGNIYQAIDSAGLGISMTYLRSVSPVVSQVVFY